MDSVIHSLNSLSTTVFRLAAIAFVLVNGAAIAAFALTRSRRLVNAWTPKIVTIDAVLLATGLGVPLLAAGARLGLRVLAGISLGFIK